MLTSSGLRQLYRRIRGQADTAPPPVSRRRRRFNAALRYVQGFAIVGGSFGLAIFLLHNPLLFILLPTGMSVVLWTLMMRGRITTPLAILFTTIVTLAYYSAVTGGEWLTHQGPMTKIVLITTSLAWALLLEPVRAFTQTAGEQRFHLIEDRNARIIEAFTAALREEIDLEQVRARLIDVVRKTMLPRGVSLWVRDAPVDADSKAPRIAGAPASLFTSTTEPDIPPVAILLGDPFASYALAHAGALEPGTLEFDSPAVRELRARDAELALPLVSQGELVGLLAVGPRTDGEDYTRDDRRLLMSLAAQATPAIRVAQMVRVQQAEVRERERIDQELRTAQQIQLAFLPKEVPSLPGWQFEPYYHPAREVGGDFYDVLPLADGCVVFVLGDVTGKGMPAALVMTAARTMLRTAAQEDSAPARVFARVNELLHADIPDGMFVTAFYAVLDPASGWLTCANAGQDYPLLRRADGRVEELRARGMPLGLMPGTSYDEAVTELSQDDSVLLFSDGLVEAHNAGREMFGLERLRTLVADDDSNTRVVDRLLGALSAFVGSDWEQEDDITLLWLAHSVEQDEIKSGEAVEMWRELDAFTMPSMPGGEREVIARVARSASTVGLPRSRLDDLGTAVGEATTNAMEHGHHYDPAKLVVVRVRASAGWLSVLITDSGDVPIPNLTQADAPDLTAKLAGTQSPRGWGLFLIGRLVDEVRVTNDDDTHTVELLVRLDGADGATDESA